MEEFFRFIRLSSTRLFGTMRHSSDEDDDDDRRDHSPSGDSEESEDDLVIPQCRHMSDAKWNEVWTELIEPKLPDVTGIVLVNPKFAPNFYVPSANFRMDYERWVEYGPVSPAAMAAMKSTANNPGGTSSGSDHRSNQYESLMQSIIRADAIFVPLHVCSPVQVLDKVSVNLFLETRRTKA